MLYALIAIAVPLTWAMFLSREAMLGFPCFIFWAVTGGYCYTISVYDWDIYYFVFFASFGMAIFCAFAAYGLREKRDTIADEEMEKGEGEYLDEGKGEESPESDGEGKPKLSEATRKLRERAKKRREGANKRMRL